MKSLAPFTSVFLSYQLPFCVRVCSSLHSGTFLNTYAANKLFERADKKLHFFKNLYPWKNLSDFSNHLKSSIIYNEGGLVALNKPYGIKIYQRIEKGNSDVQKSVSLASQEDFPYSIEECLSDLKNHLNIPDLFIIKSAERYTSGIVLLGSNETVMNRVKKSQNIAKHEKIPPYIHWAVTTGYPTYLAVKQKVGIKLVDLQGTVGKQPVITKNYSKNEVKAKKVKPVFVEHRTIATNKETSVALLEIATSSMKWNFLRVYCSSQAFSILGDTLYGSRMRKLLGQPISINPENIMAYDVQPLPESLCQRLNLPFSVSGHLLVPTMLHFRTVILPRYLKDKDLIINAPAPPHFAWTCSKLDFIVPD